MSWETKDSGERIEYESGMRRDTAEGKVDFDLICAKGVDYCDQLLTRWAELLTRGAEKYGKRNWEKADSYEELERFKSSAFRHFMQWYTGETDEDHAAAVLFNINAAEVTSAKIMAKEPAEPDLISSKNQTKFSPGNVLRGTGIRKFGYRLEDEGGNSKEEGCQEAGES